MMCLRLSKPWILTHGSCRALICFWECLSSFSLWCFLQVIYCRQLDQQVFSSSKTNKGMRRVPHVSWEWAEDIAESEIIQCDRKGEYKNKGGASALQGKIGKLSVIQIWTWTHAAFSGHTAVCLLLWFYCLNFSLCPLKKIFYSKDGHQYTWYPRPL